MTDLTLPIALTALAVSCAANTFLYRRFKQLNRDMLDVMEVNHDLTIISTQQTEFMTVMENDLIMAREDLRRVEALMNELQAEQLATWMPNAHLTAGD